MDIQESHATIIRMKSPILLIFLFSTVVLLGVTHIAALEFYLYWKFLWLDIPMHILGGAMVAISTFCAPVLGIRIPERYYTLPFVLLFVLTVGLLWEVFEIVTDMPVDTTGFVADTFLDLVMDLVGGVIGFVVSSRLAKL